MQNPCRNRYPSCRSGQSGPSSGMDTKPRCDAAVQVQLLRHRIRSEHDRGLWTFMTALFAGAFSRFFERTLWKGRFCACSFVPGPLFRGGFAGLRVIAAPGRLGSPTAMSRAPLNANVRLCNPTRSSCMDLQTLGIELQGSTGQIAGWTVRAQLQRTRGDRRG